MALDLKAMEGMAYTVEDMAEILRLHPDSVRRLIRDNRLRAVHPPGSRSYIILGEDVVRYIRGEAPIDDGGRERERRRKKREPVREERILFESE